MPFEGATPYYPTVGGGVGAPNDKIVFGTLPARDAGQSCRWTQNEAQSFKIVKPGVLVSTTVASGGAMDFGWNIELADMDPVANLPAKRIIPAGNVSVIGVFNLSAASIDNVWAIRCRIHKRSATGALTQLGVGTSAVTTPPVATDTVRGAFTVPTSETTFENGETLQFQFEIQGKGIGLGNIDAAFVIGDATLIADTGFSLPGAGLRYRYPRAADVVAGGTAQLRKKVGLPRKVTAGGHPAMARRLTLFRSFAVVGGGNPAMSRKLTLRRQFAVTAGGNPAVRKRVRLPRRVVAGGSPQVRKTIRKRLVIVAGGNPGVRKHISVRRRIVAGGHPIFARRVTVRRQFLVVAGGVTRVFAKLRISRIPSGGGGTTIIKKIFHVSDD